ncbi:hypothetical protein K1T71_013635 [Dendrolimus kikuchii]|uniref:Uncharacterized protein n=1 Tax=Dendrolimus kikuchii TaxID=765133 RepID=A0ACC1CH67_9NEOP|nr:hypothetical protein K1T71_013635 [Dendrolimus kikuchii]
MCCMNTRLLVVVSFVITVKSHDNGLKRPILENTDNFNVLLNLYKMNPLRQSKIYNALFNNILSPRPDTVDRSLNFNLNESTKEKEVKTVLHLKQIEKAIHTPKGHTKEIKPPDYDVRNVEVEKFNNIQITTPEGMNNVERIMNTIDGDLEDILGHLDSNEIVDPVTKEDIRNNKNHIANMILFDKNPKETILNNRTSLKDIKPTESVPKAYYVYDTNDVSEKTVPYNEDVVILM